MVWECTILQRCAPFFVQSWRLSRCHPSTPPPLPLPSLLFIPFSMFSLFLTSSPPSHPHLLSFPAAISCPDLPSPSNGRVVLSGSTLSSNAIYSCNRGFILVGVNRRVCQVDGTWSGEAPTCNSEYTSHAASSQSNRCDNDVL